MISQLPDHLICEILSHLPAKDAIRTSTLSNRWRSLWLWVPRLELDLGDFPNFSSFVSFGDRFFDSDRVSCIKKFKLSVYRKTKHDITSSWIDAAVKRKVEHLHVRYPLSRHLYEIPIRLYICETLTSLNLRMVNLPNAEFVSLPCLKTLYFNYVSFPNDSTFKILVSSCPVLEELQLHGRSYTSHEKVFRVLSRSLTRLTIRIYSSRYGYDPRIVINAPRLCFLCIDYYLLKTNINVNVKLNLAVANDYDRLTEIMIKRLHKFLPNISMVRDMIIQRKTFKIFYEFSKLEPLPQFGYMSRLQVELYYPYLNMLPIFLESFPNLKSLILVCCVDKKENSCEGLNQISFSHAPHCLLSSLEFVDFKMQKMSESVAERKLVKYFLENSAILKIITLDLDYRATQIQDEFVMKILKTPRRSTECKVVFL